MNCFRCYVLVDREMRGDRFQIGGLVSTVVLQIIAYYCTPIGMYRCGSASFLRKICVCVSVDSRNDRRNGLQES